MKLDSFLAVKSVPVSAEPPVAVATEGETVDGSVGFESPTVPEGAALNGASVATPAPSVATSVAPATEIVRDVTPSGIVVEYESQPKRLYRVGTDNGFGQEIHMAEVPSVTTVLDVLNKGGLTVWGMRVGIQGVLSLFDAQALTTMFDWQKDHEVVAVPQGEDAVPADVPSVEELMKEHKLTTNDVKNSAADRGTNVHDALEQWAKTGHLPSTGDFPESEVGYVSGLVAFLEDARPEPVRTEVMVGSVEHGFAGRYDLELRLNETRTLRRTPKRAYHDIGPGTYLVDFKSSKSVYPSTHFRQLAAYEAARVECGYEPTDAQYVLNANGEGSYAFVKSTATLSDFLAVLSVYNSDKTMKVTR